MKKGEIMSPKADNTDLKKIGWTPKIVTDEQVKGIFENWDGINHDF